MAASYYNSIITNAYSHVWSKYRPAILKLMVSTSTEAAQQYSLSGHEFKGVNPKEKGGYAFTLHAHKSKASNNIKNSEVAQGLLSVLQQSPKATELLAQEVYEFTLDKQFVLSVKKVEPVAPVVAANAEVSIL